jgi:hypothetical protein
VITTSQRDADRRLCSDRFFTSSFRPELCSSLGLNLVNNNGPRARFESGSINGQSRKPVSPLKRILPRTVP